MKKPTIQETLASALFVQPSNLVAAGLQKEASIRLSRDTEAWPRDVLDTLHQTHPYLASVAATVQMRQVDSDAGHGVGMVNLAPGISVPVIIKEGKLQPLDTFIAADEIYPLTRFSVETAMLQDPDIGTAVPKKSVPGASDSSITNATLPPYDGKYALAEARFSLADVLKSAPKDRLEKVAASVSPLVGLFSGSSAYKKLAAVTAASLSKEATAKVNTYPRNAWIVSEYSGPKSTIADIVKTATGPVSVEVDTHQGIIRGVLFPKLAAIVPRESGPELVSGAMFYAPTTKTASILSPKSTLPARKCAGMKSVDWCGQAITKVAAGAHGFVITGSSNRVEVVEPFQVLHKLADDNLLIRNTPGISASVRIKSDSNDTLVKSASGDLLISPSSIFVPIDRIDTLHPRVRPAQDFIQKIAFDQYRSTQAPGRVLDRLSLIKHATDLFGLHGSSQVLSNLETGPVYFEMIKGAEGSPNFPLEIGDKLKKHFDNIQKTAEELLNPALVTLGVLLHKDNALLQKQAAAYPHLVDAGFFKTAVDVTRQATDSVDRALGLNFLTQENLLKFVESADVLIESRKLLGQLLMAARLGMQIDPSPVRSAFFAIDTVIRDLGQIRNTLYQAASANIPQ